MAGSAPVVVGGCDLARSGKSAFSVLAGQDWKVRLVHLSALQSVSGPDVEARLCQLHYQYNPALWVLELNGPGGVFADFVTKNHPEIPLATVDVSLPPIDLLLWKDIPISAAEYLNLRAAMYFIVRLMLRDKRLTFISEDAELFAQLSSTWWEPDRSRAEKIKLVNKKSLKFAQGVSELEGFNFSKSPDKADSLALAAFGFAVLAQEERGEGEAEEDFICQPDFPGFFPIGKAGIDA